MPHGGEIHFYKFNYMSTSSTKKVSVWDRNHPVHVKMPQIDIPENGKIPKKCDTSNLYSKIDMLARPALYTFL